MTDDDREITRRDFVKGTLIGSGAMLLSMPAPIQAASSPVAGEVGAPAANAWNGYAGVGDYARSNGNTESVWRAAHLIRDQKVDDLLNRTIDSGESYDLVIIGGGFAGLAAARTFLRESKPGQTCLLLENHAMPGGEAKRNEFIVDGYKITGPQASNLSSVPSQKGDWYDELWTDLGIPRKPTFQTLTGHDGNLRISRTNYIPMFGIAEQSASAGYFFDKETFGVEPFWDVDSVDSGYANTAFADREKADLQRLRQGIGTNLAGENWQEWLDSITYKYYLEEVLKIHPGVTKLLDKTVCTTNGLGCDAVSAFAARLAGLPGFDKGFGGKSLYRVPSDDRDAEGMFSFPGGNDGVLRLLLKSVLPSAISGGTTFEEIHDAPYRFENFDRVENRVRIRLNSTAVRVEHDGDFEKATGVTVTYHRDGKIYRVKAGGVVSAVGGWVNKHIVKDLPNAHAEAFGGFVYGSNMIVNVALRNWKFLAKLGVSGCHFFTDNGLGTFCNIRQPMIFGENRAPLDPSKPIVMTFYVGFPQPGLPPGDQAAKSRYELLSKSFAEIESTVRRHMTQLFGSSGFDDQRDIAGIVLNRWGHSYIVCTPGFFHGVDGKPSHRDVVERRFGRIAFGHSELGGIQEWFGGVEHGERAARQVLEVLKA